MGAWKLKFNSRLDREYRLPSDNTHCLIDNNSVHPHHLNRSPLDRWGSKDVTVKQLLFAHSIPDHPRPMGHPHLTWVDTAMHDMGSLARPHAAGRPSTSCRPGCVEGVGQAALRHFSFQVFAFPFRVCCWKGGEFCTFLLLGGMLFRVSGLLLV